ncbi:MAG: DUF2272 domain-containing protein [Ottowia sp.]|uniref:DUF2272 domain-containing protein n=1 Tax=Ottowia sp. TaxID=1898956 RepID=UPI0039E2429A
MCSRAVSRRRAAWLCAAFAAGPAWAQAGDACQDTMRQPSPPLAHMLAAAALREHALMGGAVIDAGGGLIRQGFAEAEQDRAPDSDRPTWQRVWGYWRSASAGLPAALGARPSPAQLRATLVDQPWSAVFIGHVMRQAALSERQFRYSASHQDYVRAAFASTEAEARGGATAYAYRACDLGATAPRVGDLLCFARDRDRALDTFGRLRQALAARAVSMHCDLVVRRDSAGIEAVGGNVVQSVTLRRLGLEGDGSGRLWAAYLESEHARRAAGQAPPPEGEAEALLPDTHLNRRPWSVLLQLRGAVVPPEVLAAH